ncbi:FAD binding domain-containing protein [Microbaculum marinum]|uniref:FAD binding domain-containing protein n=1 Tax=Microbaculum marinum TaxID=1764581 RepID=A0AAW9RZD5_9HYPH
MASYCRPTTLDEALAIRAERPVTVLAGGTDVYPARANRVGWGDMRRDEILDVSAIGELRGMTQTADRLRLGALTTWTDLRRAALLPAFAGYQLAARDVGGAQVQNRGTLVGNICTASPAGDGIPCLLSLDAEIELASTRGRRTLPVGEFLTGYRKTACAADEIVTAILIPEPKAGAAGGFLKLGARRYLVISIAMAAAVVATDETGTITHAAIAVGACSEVARRLTDLEADLVGQPLAAASDLMTPAHFSALKPIGDIRASGQYRDSAARDLVADLLAGLAGAGDRRAA